MDPDLIWIEEAAEVYGRSRKFLDDMKNAGKLAYATFPGDRKVYLFHSELRKVLLEPQVNRNPTVAESKDKPA